tara:strand:- start:3028 stop:5280 length:2253 start_codon:yes stop_codon:yes gene_type:complete
MATKRTIDIDIKNNANKTAKDINNLNDSLKNSKKAYDAVLKSGDSYEKQLQDIDNIVKTVPLNVRDMNKQIQAYQSIALSAGRESPIGREALEKASALRDKYVDIQNETKRLADDHRNLNGVMELASIGVAGYGAVQGAMALTGTESEALQKSMQKLMAAQTLLNSVNTIAKSLEKESASMLLLKDMRTKALTVSQTIYTAVTGKATAATKLFKVALASTGIGLLIAGVAALIANFDKLTSFLDPVIDKVKEFTDFIGISNFAEDEQNEERKRRHAEYMERKKAEEAIDKAIFDAKQKQYDNEIALLESQGKDSFKLRQQKIKDSIESTKVQIENLKKVEKAQIEMAKTLGFIGDGMENESKQTRANIIKLTSDLESLETSLTVNENKENQKRVKNAQASNTTKLNNYKKYAQNRKNAARKIEDLQNSLLEEGIEKDLEINKDKFERLRVDTLANTNLTRKEQQALIELYDKQEIQQAEKIAKKYEDIEKTKNEKIDAEKAKVNSERIAKEEAINNLEISLIQDQQLKEILLLNQQYEKKLDLAHGNAELTKQLEEQQNADIAAIQEKFRKEKQAKDDAALKKEQDDNLKVQQSKIKFANDALGAIGDLANAFAGDSEKAQKRAFQINKAVGIAQAVVNTAGAISAAINPAVGGLGIPAGLPGAALAAATGAAQIATIAKTKFEGGTNDTPDIDTSGGGQAQAPSFNVVGDSGVNQLAQIQQQPVQAFVVSGEVTTSQALDRNRVENATL